MSKIQVFDPAMCCSTGVCGPEVDPALVRFASDLEWLKENGVEVERFNLSQEPAQFVAHTVVTDAMRGRDDALPIVLLDGQIVSQGTYLTRDALAGLVGLAAPKGIYTEAVATAKMVKESPARAVVAVAEKYLGTKIASKEGPDACQPTPEGTAAACCPPAEPAPVSLGKPGAAPKKCC